MKRLSQQMSVECNGRLLVASVSAEREGVFLHLRVERELCNGLGDVMPGNQWAGSFALKIAQGESSSLYSRHLSFQPVGGIREQLGAFVRENVALHLQAESLAWFMAQLAWRGSQDAAELACV